MQEKKQTFKPKDQIYKNVVIRVKIHHVAERVI